MKLIYKHQIAKPLPYVHLPDPSRYYKMDDLSSDECEKRIAEANLRAKPAMDQYNVVVAKRSALREEAKELWGKIMNDVARQEKKVSDPLKSIQNILDRCVLLEQEYQKAKDQALESGCRLTEKPIEA